MNVEPRQLRGLFLASIISSRCVRKILASRELTRRWECWDTISGSLKLPRLTRQEILGSAPERKDVGKACRFPHLEKGTRSVDCRFASLSPDQALAGYPHSWMSCLAPSTTRTQARVASPRQWKSRKRHAHSPRIGESRPLPHSVSCSTESPVPQESFSMTAYEKLSKIEPRGSLCRGSVSLPEI